MKKEYSKPEMTEAKPDCINCKWRRNISGNCHARCAHPDIKKDVMAVLKETLDVVTDENGRVEAKDLSKRLESNTILGVTGNPEGISLGWFQWPWNFDPLWLETCDGFEFRKGLK